MTKTIEDFKKAATLKNITRWNIHECSICGYLCGYIIDNSEVFYDSGCYCVTYCPAITVRSWKNILDQYECQTQPDAINEYNRFWGYVV